MSPTTYFHPQTALPSLLLQAAHGSQNSPTTPERAVPRPTETCMSPAPHTVWGSVSAREGDLIFSLVLFFFLSECDVDTSKAVVNGLAPGSNGQDKGKAFKGKPGLVLENVSRRSRGC